MLREDCGGVKGQPYNVVSSRCLNKMGFFTQHSFFGKILIFYGIVDKFSS